MKPPRSSIAMPTTRPWTPMQRSRSSAPTRSRQAYVTATVTVWDEEAATADEKLRLVEKVIQGRDFTCIAETRQRGRGLARKPSRPCLRQCPPAAGLDPQSRPHDPALGRVGGTGTRRASRRTAALLCQDRRRDPVPVVAPCRRRRAYPRGRTDRRRQERAAGADGAAVPALSAIPGVRLRFRRVDPGRGARHGRGLARSRRRAGRGRARAGRAAAARGTR